VWVSSLEAAAEEEEEEEGEVVLALGLPMAHWFGWLLASVRYVDGGGRSEAK